MTSAMVEVKSLGTTERPIPPALPVWVQVLVVN